MIQRGLTFLTSNARLLERRLADLWFGERSPQVALAVLDALRAYQNPDLGLGNALEPDARTPTSQPLAVDFGLEIAEQIAATPAGADDTVSRRLGEFADDLATYLAPLVSPEGGLPIVLPEVVEHPHADHWGDGRFPPDLNPTAGIVVRLRGLGCRADWLDHADAFCRDRIDQIPADRMGGHTLANILGFLVASPDREWSTAQLTRLTRDLANLDHFHLYPDSGYGVTPLEIAPDPSDPVRELFPADAFAAHLTELAAGQQADGGWNLTWSPPAGASSLEWRGVATLRAIRTLQLNT